MLVFIKTHIKSHTSIQQAQRLRRVYTHRRPESLIRLIHDKQEFLFSDHQHDLGGFVTSRGYAR